MTRRLGRQRIATNGGNTSGAFLNACVPTIRRDARVDRQRRSMCHALGSAACASNLSATLPRWLKHSESSVSLGGETIKPQDRTVRIAESLLIS